MSASSLTRPMFTARNVFSSSFTISATFGELTSMTVSIDAAVERLGQRRAGRRQPPTIFGTFLRVPLLVARVDPLGRKREEEVLPAFSPPRSRIGCTTSSVVPG